MKVDRATRAKLAEIGALVRPARERAELSQADLAERVGMYRENIIRIEKGRINMTVDTLVRVAAGIGAILVVQMEALPESTAPRAASPRTGARSKS